MRAPLLAPYGLAWFARGDDPLVAGVGEGLESLGVEHEWLDPAALADRFPDLATADLSGGLYEPGACLIRATAAVEALLRRAMSNGARLRLAEARPAGAGRVAIDGEELEADQVIWACGAWLGDLFDEAPIRRPGRTSCTGMRRPHGARVRPGSTSPRASTVFLTSTGSGSRPSHTSPAASSTSTATSAPPIQPSSSESAATSAAVSRPWRDAHPARPGHAVRDDAGRPLPGGFFDQPRESLAPGQGSGHGFKHAPNLGEHVADLLEDKAEPLEMFALER